MTGEDELTVNQQVGLYVINALVVDGSIDTIWLSRRDLYCMPDLIDSITYICMTLIHPSNKIRQGTIHASRPVIVLDSPCNTNRQHLAQSTTTTWENRQGNM